MKNFTSILLVTLMILVGYGISPAQKVVKESLRSQEKDRSYYLFVPESINKATTAPLIVMLHGSGRNGLSLVDRWKELAKTENIIVVGPDSLNSSSWRIPEDGPEFIYELVENLRSKYPINARRMYLFGHSAGATVALYMSLLESEYFAATAIHAGALGPNDGPFIERTKRKIPISIFVGTNDRLFPLADVRATRDVLVTRGFKVELNEIKGHTHAYYDRADEINKNAWNFLKLHELEAEPKYERYKWEK